jgi:hypothetical protein
MSPMRRASASLEIAAREAFQPAPVIAAAVALGLALAWRSSSSLGISTHEVGAEPVVYELAFLLGLLGAALGAAQEGWRWCVRRWQPAEILTHEALVIGLPAGALTLTPVAVGTLSGMGAPSPAAWGFLALAVLRPVAWGLVLLRTPLRPWPRVLALVALCWWIPAALAPSFQPVSTLPTHLVSGRSEQLPITVEGWVAETSTLLALLLAARLGLAGDRPPR